MSQTKVKTTRPLGSIRALQTVATRRNSYTNANGSNIPGVSGNAMAVPPPKEKEERKRSTPGNPVPASSARSDTSSRSDEIADKKELRDALVSLLFFILFCGEVNLTGSSALSFTIE
jgi:hypothetical protein